MAISPDEAADDLQPEYDFRAMRGVVRGKYAKRFTEGMTLVGIEPQLAAAFAGKEAINEALRWVLQLPGAVERLIKH